MTTHTYTVIIRSLMGGPSRTRRFAHRWQADAFYSAMVSQSENNGRATSVSLMHGDECLRVY